MSNIDKQGDNNPEFENSAEEQPKLPKKNMQAIFQELEIMALQKGGRNSFDLSNLNEGQIDKVLETMSQNESNAFAFHTKRLDTYREIEIRRIDASIINQRTLKFALIGLVIFVLPGITILILFFKESYFIPWLTFLTGLLGGFGLSKVASSLLKQQETKNPIIENEDE